MVGERFVFEQSAIDETAAVHEVAAALEKRVELYSREKMPGLWARIDSIPKNGTQPKKRSKLLSAVILLLGIVAFVAGAAEPLKLSFLLIVGLLAILYGAFGLMSRDAKPTKYEREAAAVLKGRGELERGHILVEFTDAEMVVTIDGELQRFGLEMLEFAIERESLFLVGFEGRAVILQKSDITVGEIGDFAGYLREKVKACSVYSDTEE